MTSRLERGRVAFEPTLVDVNQVIAETVAEVGRGLDIRLDVRPRLRAMSDANQLKQVVVNLIVNASIHGREPILIDADERAGWVEIGVTDRGEGVPDEFVPRLFDKFTQVDRHAAGSGLGLSIVRGLVEAQHGEVLYETATPHGSRFVVRLLHLDRPTRQQGSFWSISSTGQLG